MGRNFRLRCRCAHTRYAAAVAKPDSASPLRRIAGRLVAVRPSKPDGVGETVFEVPFADQGKSRNAMKVSHGPARPGSRLLLALVCLAVFLGCFGGALVLTQQLH